MFRLAQSTFVLLGFSGDPKIQNQLYEFNSVDSG